MVRRLILAATLAGTVLLATQPLDRIYHGTLLARLLLGAALIPVALSTVARRLPAWPVAPVSALALGGYTLYAVQVSARSGGVPGALLPLWRDALHNGIPRLLTALIPVEPQPDTVLVPVIATWLAALAAAELALRARWTLAGFAPPTLLYLGTLVVVGPNAPAQLWTPLAFATLAALGLAVAGRPDRTAEPPDPVDSAADGAVRPAARERPRRPRSSLAVRARLVAGAAIALAVIVGLAVAVAPALADRVTGTPTDPRRYVNPPDLSAEDENPLIRLSGWALNPTEKLFDTDIAGLPTASPTPSLSPSPTPNGSPTPSPAPSADGGRALRVRLAVLSDFDGVNWRVDGDYREAGRVLPAVTGPGAPSADAIRPGASIDEQITIRDLSGSLLPAVPDVREVDGLRVGYDQSTGTLIRPDGLSDGLTYTVHSQQSTVDGNLLPGADVPSGPSVARFLGLGIGAPDAMTRLATQLGAGRRRPVPAGPGDRAVPRRPLHPGHRRA